jgi:predicted amidohydrolase YtcJ
MTTAPGAAPSSGDAEPRLYHGAHVLLPEPAPPGTTIATVGDRIVAVGDVATCMAAVPSGTRHVDLGGRTVVPGFIDAHLHPLVMCVFEQQLRFDDARCVADVLDAVADRARTTPADTAIVGFQLDDACLIERRLPTADELDAAAAGRAVVIVRRDGHHAVASSGALRAVGLDRPGEVPAAGEVVLGADGRPTGLVREAAVAPLLGLLPDIELEALEAGLAAWSARLLRQGVTAISAMCQTTAEGPSGDAGELEAFGWSVLVDQVPFDVQTILITPSVQAVHDARTGALHRPAAWRRVDAVKLFLDGTLGGHTACMHQAFTDRPGATGLAALDPDEAYRRMVAAHCDGFQICVHAIGDRANHDAAQLFGRLLREHPGPHRHRVEHASVLEPRTIEQFAELGITAVVQPISLRSEGHWLSDRLGDERIARTYPFRSLLDAGVTLAGSSDAPIESSDVLAAMGAAVDRAEHAPEQALTGREALAVYTTGASAARSTEDSLGSIAVGRRADLVVLDDDPTTVAPDRLASIRVLATVVAGHERFRHDDLGPAGRPHHHQEHSP